jgi:hypothetical protein
MRESIATGSAVDVGGGRVGNGNTGRLSACVRSLSWVLPLSARIQPWPELGAYRILDSGFPQGIGSFDYRP